MTKSILFMRHGATEQTTNENRGPTEEGRGQAQNTAAALLQDGRTPDLIWHSPLPRAHETASCVRNFFAAAGTNISMEEKPWLTEKTFAEMDAETPIRTRMAEFPTSANSILCVTHQPNIEMYALDLTTQFPDRMSHGDALLLEQPGDDWKTAADQTVQFRKKFSP
ncbi:MAG: histidine phosphatase family protein [Alphaproteobacteria bacterium]|nr:histidine phosphatase family protein [Alphaproteobacteria bacterium]